jgi:aminoglycoside phosphotransferase (APT) family kinase protein
MDLVVDEGEDRALLLDWKTHALGDARTAEAVMGEYALQQSLYALALLRAGWREVTVEWVLLEDLAARRGLVVSAADAPHLEREVRAALAPLRSGGRPAAATTPQPFCSACPGLEAMCVVASARG